MSEFNNYGLGQNTNNWLGCEKTGNVYVPSYLKDFKDQRIRFVAGTSASTLVIGEDFTQKSYGQTITQIENIENLIDLKSGYYGYLCLFSDGKVSKGDVTLKNVDFFNDKPVMQIARCVSEYLYLCENGDLYSEKSSTPLLVSKNVSRVFAGLYAYHFFYETNDGKLYAKGQNSDGRCGIGSTVDCSTPKEVTEWSNKEILHIGTGYEGAIMLAEVDGENRVYFAGSKGNSGVSGSGQLVNFTNITNLNGKNPIQVDIGCFHCLVVCENGDIYGWGNNAYGQTMKSHNIPTKLDFTPKGEVAVRCGPFRSWIYSPINSVSTLATELNQLLESGILADIEVNGCKAHSVFLQYRTGQPMSQISSFFSGHSKEETELFLHWAYTGSKSNYSKITPLLTAFKINKELFDQKSGNNGLVADLTTMFNDDKTKDFTLLIPDLDNEDSDEDEQEENEDEFDEIPVHKFILVARCGLFREMFTNINEEKDNVKDFSGKSIDTMECLIKFFYTDFIELNADLDFNFLQEELENVSEYFQLNENIKMDKVLQKAQKAFL
ncbi:hypothetical protein M0812_26736 [Anaeramoeba flamelloides]|uniref:BTB domain-containing protein n=1 Tax=Anaeramoeba flamelloides TaxID=1746091 RepID=A0AAV7YBE5_9EUKA|nr:hypothetical protein M0812_26736 [Anaeramoeba flamelloides]